MLPFTGIKDYIYGGVILLLSISLIYFKLSVSSLEVDKANLEKQIVSYNTVMESTKHDNEIKQIEVIKEVEVIKKEVQTKIQKVKEYVRDENKSDCINAIDFARVTF